MEKIELISEAFNNLKEKIKTLENIVKPTPEYLFSNGDGKFKDENEVLEIGPMVLDTLALRIDRLSIFLEAKK